MKNKKSFLTFKIISNSSVGQVKSLKFKYLTDCSKLKSNSTVILCFMSVFMSKLLIRYVFDKFVNITVHTQVRYVPVFIFHHQRRNL